MHARVVSQTLNLRDGASPTARVVGQLVHGQVVTTAPGAPIAERWLKIAQPGTESYVARRLVAQSADAPLAAIDREVLDVVGKCLWDSSQKYDGVTYRLGCKAKRSGDGLAFSGKDVAGAACSGSTVDCSGWVAGLFQLVAAKLNDEFGRTIFDNRDIGRLANHSDGQIAGVGQAAGQVYSGRDIDQLPLRSGLLFGLNAGDYDWEGAGRAFDIDHIVIGVNGPQGFAISQSSSGGGGVNTVSWAKWREKWASSFDSYRVHCVDLMALGAWVGGPAIAADAAPPDLLAAPAG